MRRKRSWKPEPGCWLGWKQRVTKEDGIGKTSGVFAFLFSSRTVRFWDLEKFHTVSCIEEEATPVR